MVPEGSYKLNGRAAKLATELRGFYAAERDDPDSYHVGTAYLSPSITVN